MYSATAIWMADKLKQFCSEHDNCSKCPFGYYPTLIGSNGGRKATFTECRINEQPSSWTIPEEVDSNDED